MKSPIGDRMKAFYEDPVTKAKLPRRTYTIMRMDGRAFHTYTRKCEKPFDLEFISALDQSALALLKTIDGAVFAYVQSDEISILMQDFSTLVSEPWFGGVIQKQVSVGASIITGLFNEARREQLKQGKIPREHHPSFATFDTRVFSISTSVEVANYFIWRQKDAERNSLQSYAQKYFSQKKLHGVGQNDLHDLLHTKGINWNDLPDELKRGRLIRRVENPDNHLKIWTTTAPDIWTQSTQLQELIPPLPSFDLSG